MIFIRTKQSDYIAKPRRRTEIQRFGREFREKLNLDPKQAFPVMDFLEHSLNDYYPDVEIIIDEEIKGAYAYYDVITKTIHLDEKVYENACDKVPRHLFTVMHEIAHMMLLEKDGCLILARRNEKVKKFQDPEWQANELAAELLAPSLQVRNMSIPQIMDTYHVSHRCAEIQKNKDASAN